MNKRFIKLWQQLKDLQEMGHEVDDYDKYLIGVLEQLRENWPDGDEDKLADQLGVTTLHYLHIKAISEIEIACLPGDIPEFVEIDISALALGEAAAKAFTSSPGAIRFFHLLWKCCSRGCFSVPSGAAAGGGRHNVN